MNKSTLAVDVKISVIVPCHNPRLDYFGRVLEALKAQSLSLEAWELVVIDNASDPPLVDWADVSWHPHGRIVREETLGLTPARLRGFAESSGNLILMADDDNVLAPDYIEQSCRIADKLPQLGAFGGSIEPDFDEPPAAWTKPYWQHIAIRPVSRSVWSNDINHWESTPSGAGMCVRRTVALHYRDALRHNPMRRALDRTGSSLVSGGDTDIAWTACSMGMGMGCFTELRLTHLIPPQRLSQDYLVRMFEGKGYSGTILNALWKRADPEAPYEGYLNLLKAGFSRLWTNWKARRFQSARRRGMAKARCKLVASSLESHDQRATL